MKNKLTSLLFCTSIAIALVACSSPSNSTAPENNDQLKSDTTKTEVQANFICPMGKDCGYSATAGKCSSCGMELVAAK